MVTHIPALFLYNQAVRKNWFIDFYGMNGRLTMRRLFTSITVFLSLFFITVNAYALVDVEARYWFTNLDSNVQANSGAVIGTKFDLVNDFGLDDHENFVEGRITLELGNHSLRYAYIPLSWSGDAAIMKSVNFAGQVFLASTVVATDVQIDYHRISYRYDIINKLKNRLGVIAEIKYLDGRIRLTDAALGLDESTRLQVPIPAIGVGGQLAIPFLAHITAEITGMSLGTLAYIVDGEANIGFKPLPFVDVSAGYRYLKFHVDKGGNTGSFTMRGPFVTLSAHF